MSARRYVRVSRNTRTQAGLVLRVWAILTLTLGPIAFALAYWWGMTH